MQQFIDPKTIARIKDLPLVAKTIAEGFLLGLQPSMQRGVGIEFSQYRAYEEGDELNRIDWKLFARSDRYYVREAERESEIDIWFLLDVSRSMLQTSQQQDSRSWSKLDYAKHLIASLAYLANKQGDSFGFMSLDEKTTKGEQRSSFLASGNGERHWQKLLINLMKVTEGSFFPNVERLQHQIERLQKPSIIFVISDFHETQSEITDFLSKINSSLSEVVALQLNCDDELTFDYKGSIRFKDLETNQEILVSAQNAKTNYLQAYRQYQSYLDTSLAEKNISLSRLNINQPLDAGLFEYLTQRNRVIR